MPGRGMRGNHRRSRQLQHLVKGFVADVRDVDHHAKPVHFRHQLAAEGAETVPWAMFVIGRIADMVAEGVGQRDVADAAVAEERQVFEFAVDRRAVFHAHGQADQAARPGRQGLVRRADDGEPVRRPADQRLHAVDQPVGQFVTRTLRFGSTRRVDRHEGYVQPAATCALVVEITVLRAPGDVRPRSFQAIRDVDVGVDQQVIAHRLGSLRREIRRWGLRLGGGKGQQQDQAKCQYFHGLSPCLAGAASSPQGSMVPSVSIA